MNRKLLGELTVVIMLVSSNEWPPATASHSAACACTLSVTWLCADPFQTVELPEVIEEFLDDGVARCIAFNRRGTLLAG